MSAEKSEGIILRVTDFSETSRIVAIFTRDFGRISALAKGGRRLRGPFESSLDLLSTCQLVFLRKSTSNLDLLTEARLVERFRPAEKELACLYAGYYVAELLLGLTEDYDPHPRWYDEARGVLANFADLALLRRSVVRFELVSLREIGQLPDFESCSECGEIVLPKEKYGYSPPHGGLICAGCQADAYTPAVVHGGSAVALQVLAGEDPDAWRALQLTTQQVKEVRRASALAICHALGHRPKMLSLLP